jgi:hypothetical protein
VLITGDTPAEKLRDVRTSGIPVLHKPVKPELLKRTLSGLLG